MFFQVSWTRPFCALAVSAMALLAGEAKAEYSTIGSNTVSGHTATIKSSVSWGEDDDPIQWITIKIVDHNYNPPQTTEIPVDDIYWDRSVLRTIKFETSAYTGYLSRGSYDISVNYYVSEGDLTPAATISAGTIVIP